jgi:ABC-type glycerol-3-phosphate transport system substrate-binding protein
MIDRIRASRRTLLVSLGGLAATSLMAACSAPAAPAKPAETKPAADAKPAAPAAPAAQPAPAKPAEAKPAGAEAAKPADKFQGIGGAQPTAIPAVKPGTGLKNPQTFKAPKTKATGPTKLTFWQYVGFHVEAQKFISDEYKKVHDPNVELEITAYPGLNEQRAAVKAALAAASPTPDILALEPGADSVEYYTNGGIFDFEKVFADDPEYKASFWPNALQLQTINGKVVSVPAVTNTVVVYYNKNLFKKHNVQPPETLQQLEEVSKVFKAAGIPPLMMAIGEDRNHPIFPFYTMAGGMKLDGLLREADLGTKSWTDPQLMEVAAATEKLIKQDYWIPNALGIKQADGFPIFANGQAAMFWGGQWMRTSIRAAIKEKADFDLGIFPFPAVMPGGPKPVLSSLGITISVNTKSKNPELAFEMVKAMTGLWGKIEYSKFLGISPNGPISPEAIAYQMERMQDPIYPEFLKLQPTGTTRILFTPAVQEALYQGWQAVFAGRKDAKTVMEEAEAASKKAGERKFKVG